MKVNMFTNRLFLATCLLAVWCLNVFGQDDFIRQPSGLESQGIPTIPTSLAKSIAPYTSAYGMPLVGWDQVKREIWVRAFSNTISRIESPGAPQKRWIHLHVMQIYGFYFHPQAKYFIYNKDTDGNEAFQMYLYNIQTNQSTLLSDGRSRNTEFVWSNSGDAVIYSRSLASEGPGVSLYHINPLDPKSNRLLVNSEGNYLKIFDWSPDDRQAVFCEYPSLTAVKLWTIDLTNGEKTLLSSSKAQAEAYYRTPKFSLDGKGIYVITDNNSETRQLAYLDLKTKKFEYLTTSMKQEIDDFRLSPDGKCIALTTNADGVSKLYFLDTETQKIRHVSSALFGIISDLKWHNNSTDVAFNFRSLRTPNDIYSVDAKTEKLERWTQSVTNDLDVDQLAQPEIIRWKSLDGLQIPGFIYRPPLKYTGKRPVIIYLHGGPEEQYRPGFGYELNYFLHEMGIALIYPNFRGSTGYGKTFVRSDDGLRREAVMKDIGGLLDWVKSQPDLDAQRVMIRGSSYGGYLALTTAYQFSDRIRCVVSEYGIANLATFIERTEASRRELQRTEFGDERDPKIRAFLERIAPLNHVSKITKPLLVIHGKNDRRVSIEEAVSIVKSVQKSGVPVWYIFANDEGHGFAKRNNWDFRLYAIVLFTQEYLLAK